MKRQHLPAHLVLGSRAAESAIAYSSGQIAEASAWRKVTASADFRQEYPVDLPADEPMK